MSAQGQLNAERAFAIAEDLGLDTDKLEEDAQRAVVTAHFDRSVALAERVDFEGTPSMLIGDRLARVRTAVQNSATVAAG
jgi:protein-disulfide isomerase-like protein with CxxC motif